MKTITVSELKELLDLCLPDAPVYVVGEHGENGNICDVALHCNADDEFKTFEVRIDYIVE